MDADNVTPSKYITLISSDGYEFIVLREAAMVSPVIKSMVDVRNQFLEANSARCSFEEINGVVLEKVVEYFHYWYKHKNNENVPDMDIPTELCLEILMVADFLGLSKT